MSTKVTGEELKEMFEGMNPPEGSPTWTKWDLFLGILGKEYQWYKADRVGRNPHDFLVSWMSVDGNLIEIESSAPDFSWELQVMRSNQPHVWMVLDKEDKEREESAFSILAEIINARLT
ncbi:MAG: hypothetical protein HN726_03530 [Candidatus Magasanikbacteria bacterium]|jgi:hypothetical protein|nr:hypothetical protein [Candidatus Magasanikbacteria bacterium]MBT4221372.1 hypothetical protein [Candidatus Magasanikbacteria bacterium]MBT4350780.1 hypothetical protein [Candidatus Magasanikbacteria bacterium]MBT4541544.1 hypothetical protein [Candidatus Magasanikbacteria bacterium]MBT6253496.1 hypothetical protein [Candidatus Magasanikbacteria bacterium]